MKTIAYEYVTDYEIMYTMLTVMGYKITNVDHWQYTFANASGNEIVLKRLHGATNDPMVDHVMAILEEATRSYKPRQRPYLLRPSGGISCLHHKRTGCLYGRRCQGGRPPRRCLGH